MVTDAIGGLVGFSIGEFLRRRVDAARRDNVAAGLGVTVPVIVRLDTPTAQGRWRVCVLERDRRGLRIRPRRPRLGRSYRIDDWFLTGDRERTERALWLAGPTTQRVFVGSRPIGAFQIAADRERLQTLLPLLLTGMPQDH